MTERHEEADGLGKDHSGGSPILAPEHQGEWHRGGTKIFFLVLRMILGAVFVYASVDKILHPAAFAEIVYNYQILPHPLINLTAVLLPWLELFIGLFLILGLWLPGALLLGNLLLATFLGALAFNMARGLDIHCGCFTTSSSPASETPMAWYLLRDGVFFFIGLYLFSHSVFGKKGFFF